MALLKNSVKMQRNVWPLSRFKPFWGTYTLNPSSFVNKREIVWTSVTWFVKILEIFGNFFGSINLLPYWTNFRYGKRPNYGNRLLFEPTYLGNFLMSYHCASKWPNSNFEQIIWPSGPTGLDDWKWQPMIRVPEFQFAFQKSSEKGRKEKGWCRLL